MKLWLSNVTAHYTFFKNATLGRVRVMKPELWQKTQTSVGFKLPPVNPSLGAGKI